MTKKLQKTTVSNEKLKQEITKRKKEEKHIKYLSFHDEMTGLYNRRYFENEMLRLNKSRKLPISIIVTDIDGLKKINDNYGHKKGDEYIIMAAEILKKITRKEDIVSRIGGDEFAILLPKTAKEKAEKIIARIKKKTSPKKDKELTVDIALGFAVKNAPDCTASLRRDGRVLLVVYR